ncbi:dihydrofolate reductase DfrA [Maricurvus nonylphenolicus]|uniref:type 3 dihydrofolate reductase n=1 Tax=Maricurvus nonylphenolicus TaxID=1008307 RepID=UPI0036F2F61A
MRLAMIVAAAENHVIGRDNDLPWHLPNDLKYFKATTMGKPIVMGRKTYDSIGRPLPGRPNIVITRNAEWQVAPEHREAVTIVSTVEDALAAARRVAEEAGVEEVMVIGGAEIYRMLFDQADRLYLTRVHGEVEGDAHFPELTASDWQQVSAERHTACAKNPFDYSFFVYDRVTKS